MLAMLTNSLSPHVMLADLGGVLSTTWNVLLILLGFSVVVFFHELGHFSVAKWAGVRVERFAVGFGPELFGVTRGETRYSFNILPLGGYVKMLGQEDFEVDKTGEIAHNDDPRSFINKPVGHRMAIVSAGVIMNLLVAALLFMVVYMIGRVETAPIVGQVVTDTPAAKAGLQVGDRIHKINDFEISSFDQIATAVRLADYLAVQNTYLSTFQALGGFGLVLGTIGLTAVLLRNVWERRGELALLRALGFSRHALGLMVLAENAGLLCAGLVAGLLSATLAIAPHIAARPASIPWLSLGATLVGVLAVGLGAGLAATFATLRAPLLPSLRAE